MAGGAAVQIAPGVADVALVGGTLCSTAEHAVGTLDSVRKQSSASALYAIPFAVGPIDPHLRPANVALFGWLRGWFHPEAELTIGFMTHRPSPFVLAVALVVLSGAASAQQAVPDSEGLSGPNPSAVEGPASRENAAPTGGSVAQHGAIEIGLRVAYAIPFGTRGTTETHRIDTKLSDEINGMIPIEIDAGYRITPRFYVGLSFQYGFAFVNTSTNPECAGDPRFSPTGQSLSCSSRDLRLGANAQVHLAPGHSFDPWLGLGVGYEWLSFDVSGPLINATVDAAASGLESANFQLGGDIAVARNVAVGPFFGVSLGHYRSVSMTGPAVYSTEVTNEALHEWLEFGLRGAFDVSL